MAARRKSTTVALTAVLLTARLFSAQQLTQRDAESMAKKLAVIMARGSAATPVKPQAALRTAITEREVNAWLKFLGRDQLPTGVVDPSLVLTGERRVRGRALVDLDAVRKAKERSWLDPAAYLTGSLELLAAGIVQTSNGKGTIQIESASVAGVPIPKSLLQELVTFYSKSPDLPDGLDLDKPFNLPASIREVEIQRGGATIVQ